MTTALGVTELEVQCDSLLIVSQVDGDYTTKDDRMVAYLNVVTAWKTKFSRCDFKQVPRSKNNHADSLGALTSVVNFQFRCEITIEHIPKPSIKKPDEEILRLYRSPGWKDPIISFLKNGPFPEDKAEAQSYNISPRGMYSLGNFYTRNHTPMIRI